MSELINSITGIRKTITPRSYSVRRVLWGIATPSFTDDYEKLANLIKKYGCAVSKVSDGMDKEDNFYTAIYFDIPIDSKEAFLKEERELGKRVSAT